ncbi:MAG: EamA family transporter, partial [Pseudolabrys sp.]|nr:EamA family transporter [Pseudolabrys sp.]
MPLSQIAVHAAPLLFVFLWSTGFIGAKYGLPYIEPFTFLAVRMFFVVLLHVALVWLGGLRLPDAREAGHNV